MFVRRPDRTLHVARYAVPTSLALLLLIPSCASRSVGSGVAVASIGRGLSTHAHAVPQGAEACALHEAIAARTPGTPEKPVSETCGKAANSDLLWRRALIVLAAYSQKLEAVASGASPETSGQLEAALTGVRGDSWIDAESGQETAARDAVAKLVNQMATKSDKADLDKTVTDAAPHVKTLCTGLGAYLDEQVKKFDEVGTELEKKRSAKTDRRCATFDSRTICVSESVLDRIVYASSFGGLAMQKANHLDARDNVAMFCAAHAKLEAAAGSGTTGKDETYVTIVDAVKAVPRAEPQKQPAAPAAAESSDKPTDIGGKK
jgi:hypothetical protein